MAFRGLTTIENACVFAFGWFETIENICVPAFRSNKGTPSTDVGGSEVAGRPIMYAVNPF